MVNYDTRIPIGESSGICQEIASEYEERLNWILDATEDANEEYAFGIWKINGKLHISSEVEGESSILKKSITSQGVNDIRQEIVDRTGVDDGSDFYKQSEWVALVHTHPGGDPSPSAADIIYLMNRARNVKSITSEFSSYMSTLPVITALLAVSRHDNGDIIITGFEVKDDLPGMEWIEHYEGQAKSYNVKSIPRYFDSEDRRLSAEEARKRAYDELIHNITEGQVAGKGVLNKCHAVVKR